MKNESVSQLLESGEIQMTDDVKFMIDAVLSLFGRGVEQENGGQFISHALNLLQMWRDSLEITDTDLADEAIANIVAGGKL